MNKILVGVIKFTFTTSLVIEAGNVGPESLLSEEYRRSKRSENLHVRDLSFSRVFYIILLFKGSGLPVVV